MFETAVWTSLNKRKGRGLGRDRQGWGKAPNLNKEQRGSHLYLGHKAFCDGHRVSVALFKMMKKVPETSKTLKEVSIWFIRQ